MFHNITCQNKNETGNLSISFEALKSLIESMIERNFQFNSINDIEGGPSMSANQIWLTFDDGYSGIYDILAPYLEMKNIPFAVFIALDYLDKTNYLTKNQLAALAEMHLCTIGSHTLSHPLLRQQNDEISRYEILNSKLILENIISREVDYLAFPYGSVYAVSKRDIEYARQAGYKLAFSSLKGYLSKEALHEKWFLPRINVNGMNYRKLLNSR